MAVIKSEFFLALNQVATERGISPEDVIDSIKAAVLAAYKKDYGPESDDEVETQAGAEDHDIEEEDDGLDVQLNQETGEMHIMKDGEDITPPGFGRIAAQTARQVILQQIREAEKRTIVKHYTGQIGTIVRGRVIRFDGRNVLLDIGKAEGMLPPEEQIRTERYRLNDAVTVYISEIREDLYGNSRIIVSRVHPDLVKELFAKEVPEIESGTVKVQGVVREPGERTKIAVHSDQSGVDPVGACVGQKGIRVKAVTDELGGAEKIDIIQYNEDDKLFIREALSPASVTSVETNDKKKLATVTVDEEQAPLAIGKNGVNVNLASRLTGYEIDIVQIDEEGKKSTPDTPTEDIRKPKPDENPGSNPGDEPVEDVALEARMLDDMKVHAPKDHTETKGGQADGGPAVKEASEEVIFAADEAKKATESAEEQPHEELKTAADVSEADEAAAKVSEQAAATEATTTSTDENTQSSNGQNE